MNIKEPLDIPLSNEEYVALKGVRCPFCGSCGIEGDSFDFDGAEASQKIRCLDCDNTWTDVYKLVGFHPSSDLTL